ncbi:alginate export family protein [uncultured Maricaulis sp.]|uniref:alginate export family protein n=1 Tax=uncultured Maricaulis sp. TaxID=174710 RepID=UPI0026114B9F|nr:alginate export family protein [uncultured Maricaulis sp.]
MKRFCVSKPQTGLFTIPAQLLAIIAVFMAGASGARAQNDTSTDFRFGVSGETRARYESLNGQFRAGRAGSDQALLLRTLLHARLSTPVARFGIELQDSRAYFDDSGTPLSTGIVNPLDILQAYAQVDAPSVFGDGSDARITLGRQTVSIGSKRQIERISYANVIKSYTGAYYTATSARGDRFHALMLAPVARRPGDRVAIGDNQMSGDEEEWNRTIWAVHYQRPDLIANVWPGLSGDLFVYGLEERDTDSTPTPDRHYVTPGFRLHRAPAVGQLDLDLEAAWRFGRRRATSASNDTTNLRVSAGMLFAALGYTFQHDWKPRLALEYYWASGDHNPDDNRFDQYERLFGSRRTDLNNTSLHGPLTPANLQAPGMRLELAPSPDWDGRLAWSAASLDSARDSWVIAGLRDESGQSGRFIGHTLDGRVRYRGLLDGLELELGASILLPGGFAENAPGSPAPDRTLFGYGQATFTF